LFSKGLWLSDLDCSIAGIAARLGVRVGESAKQLLKVA